MRLGLWLRGAVLTKDGDVPGLKLFVLVVLAMIVLLMCTGCEVTPGEAYTYCLEHKYPGYVCNGGRCWCKRKGLNGADEMTEVPPRGR